MGRMLEALKHIEDQTDSSQPVWTTATETSTTDDWTSHENNALADESKRPEPLDPRYREVVGAVLSQLNVRDNVVLLIAGFRDDEPRGGQLAALYPVLASHVDGGLVVIDADFQHAGLSEQFDACREQGLADVLAGQEIWQNAVCKTQHPGLSILPGNVHHKSLEENDSKRVSHKNNPSGHFPVDLAPILAETRLAHRLVIIDTVLDTPKEMARWAAICDTTILFARLEVTPRRQVHRAIQAIQAGGGQVLGCVLLEP